MTEAFQPKWASPPGDTIAEIMKRKVLSPREFSELMGLSLKQTGDLLSGKTQIDSRLAHQLEQAVGASASFWLLRESQYREDLARLAFAQESQVKANWLRLLPVKDMVEFGWIKQKSDPEHKLAECLGFFGVSTIAAWHEKYRGVQNAVAFRTSGSFESQPGAVAAWLRQGERKAEDIECADWDADKFRRALPHIRTLTRKKNPKTFIPALTKLCASCGVAVVIARAPGGCRASGATRFLTRAKALLMLSFRHRTDDHFWFTFFHEAGHLLLHGHNALFVEDLNLLTTHEEEEANTFAMEILIPPKYRDEMLGLPKDFRRVARFAQRIGISHGIIVGQLQHHKRIAQNELNFMKERFQWS